MFGKKREEVYKGVIEGFRAAESRIHFVNLLPDNGRGITVPIYTGGLFLKKGAFLVVKHEYVRGGLIERATIKDECGARSFGVTLSRKNYRRMVEGSLAGA